MWQTLYDGLLLWIIPSDDLVFINLGYAPLDRGIEISGPESLHRCAELLYERVVAGVDLRDRDVLEVGSGRGGGAAHVMRRFHPRSLIGLDRARGQVGRSARAHRIEGLSFRRGNAMALPFADKSFDAVLNVESSHCYPSRQTFFGEVWRVLKPGGYFLLCDVIYPDLDGMPLERLESLLEEVGFSFVEAEDITENVIRARDVISDSPFYRETLKRWMPSVDPLVADEAFFLRGTINYQDLVSRKLTYGRWVLQKP